MECAYSVPAKRVLGHDRCRNLLCSNAAALSTAAALTASTARRDSTIACTVHPSSCAAGDRSVSHAAPCARHRAGALMRNALVPVPTSDEEHGSTVSNGTHNGTSSNTGGRGVDRAAGVDVASQRTAVARTSSRCCRWVRSLVRTRVVARKFAGWQRAGSVDQVGEIINCLVLVAPEGISRVAQLSSKFVLQVFGNGE